MDRKRNSEKPEPEHRPIEPEMPKGIAEQDPAATEPANENRSDDL